MKNRRPIIILCLVVLLLMIPFITMQCTTEVNWGIADFLIMGIMLTGTGLGFELVMRKLKNFNHRILTYAAILLAFFLIWAELAVGIFSTPFAGS